MGDNSTEFVFVTEAFTPETIPQARLAQYLAALADLYGDKGCVHFVGLEKHSLAIRSRAEPEVEEDVAERVEQATDEEAPADTRRAYDELSALVVEDGKPARIERSGGGVVIEFETGKRRGEEATVYGPFWQRGHLTGTVIGLGGKTDVVSVRLQVKDRTVTCKAKRSTARNLRDKIWGDPIRVEGSGKWIREADGTWKLLRFDIADFEDVDAESLSTTVARLRAIHGKWKERPDPLAELEALRNDEGKN